MSPTGAFLDELLARGGEMLKLGELEVIANFGDTAAEYRLISRKAALVPRLDRGLLELTGVDRQDWIHNLVTNQVKHLLSGEGAYAFALNVKGRILFDVNILVRADSIWLDVDRRFLLAAKVHLKKYIIVEDVTVTNRSEEYVRVGLTGLQAFEIMGELGAPHAGAMPALGLDRIRWDGLEIPFVRHDFCGPPGVELFVPADRAIDVWSALCDRAPGSPIAPAGWEAANCHRIEAGIPWPISEINDDVVPAETMQLERAVSFTKGCYLGQEIVERMRSRGALAQRLVAFEIEGDRVPLSNADVVDEDGKHVGTVTSACHSVARNGVIGMGYLKVGIDEESGPVRLRWGDYSTPAKPAPLPLMQAQPCRIRSIRPTHSRSDRNRNWSSSGGAFS
jgi:folate-binding protein YgfZ